MISLRTVLLSLVTLVCREVAGVPSPGVLPAGSLQTPLLAIAGATLGFGLVLRASALSLLSRVPDGQFGPLAVHVQFARVRRVVESLWLLCLPLVLLTTGWAGLLNSLANRGDGNSGLPLGLVLLGYYLPSLLVIVLFELTAAQVDAILTERSSGSLPDAKATLPA